VNAIFCTTTAIKSNRKNRHFTLEEFFKQEQQRVAVGTRKWQKFISGCQVASAAGRSMSRPPPLPPPPVLLRLLLVLLCSQFCD